LNLHWEKYPKFRAKARAFYRSLHLRLSTGLPAVVRFGGSSEGMRKVMSVYAAHGRWRGLLLTVSTPPASKQPSRMLHVLIRMHDKASRDALGIDWDYGLAHCHVVAVEYGESYAHRTEWKSAKEALVGIREWVNGTLYIPGPSH
jgi:hypothetical protein